MRMTFRVDKLRPKECFLPQGPDLIVHLPEGLSQCEHWQLHPSRQWKLNQTVRNPRKVFFYTIAPSCWGMISKPPGDTCPRALAQQQGLVAAPHTPLLCPPVALAGDRLQWEKSRHSKITTAIQCIAGQAEVSSHRGCIFPTANCPLVISQGTCIAHRILSIHRTLLSLRGGYFNSSVMSVATRKQGEIEYEVHFS